MLNLSENIDQVYIKGLQKQDSRVYEVVFKKYYPSLVVFVERHVGDRDVAKDIVQDIFFKLYERSHSLPEDFNLHAWLYKVGRNAALDHLSHLQVVDRHKFLMAEAMLASSEVNEDIDEEVCRKVNEAIESLPEQCRVVIQLNVVQGKKYEEIAEELGITVNTVRTQVSRGYKKLRERLSEERNALLLLLLIRFGQWKFETFQEMNAIIE